MVVTTHGVILAVICDRVTTCGVILAVICGRVTTCGVILAVIYGSDHLWCDPSCDL